jgi:hypothetical protein
MIRLTKGMIRNYFPDYDYFTSTFEVKLIPPTDESLRILQEALGGASYDERGDGVIRNRYGITNTGLSGIWFFTFYDATWYLVRHVQGITST